LFSESPSRIVISFAAADENAVREIAERNKAPFAIIGRVGGTRLTIDVNGDGAVEIEVSEMEAIWRSALSDKLQAEVVSV
jgi:phosphoribosylformylglycinamidine synthase